MSHSSGMHPVPYTNAQKITTLYKYKTGSCPALAAESPNARASKWTPWTLKADCRRGAALRGNELCKQKTHENLIKMSRWKYTRKGYTRHCTYTHSSGTDAATRTPEHTRHRPPPPHPPRGHCHQHTQPLPSFHLFPRIPRCCRFVLPWKFSHVQECAARKQSLTVYV